MGDYAFPCFQLAKDFRKSPEIIAKELSKNIRKSDFHVGLLKPSSTRSVILETPPNVCMESRNSYEKK